MSKKKNINFDVNALERPTRHVLKTVEQLYSQGYANPSTAYKEGREAAEMVEKAREKVAKALGCYTDEIIFTSGASESNSWVQANYLLDVDGRSHHSLQRMADLYVPRQLRAIPLVVSETGECLINEIASNQNKDYFVDLTQAIGKIKIDLHCLKNVMFASASGQKFGGIQGAGILYISRKWKSKFKIMIYGSQENGLRGGTLNVPAIVAFGEAIEEAIKNMEKNNTKVKKIVNYIIDEIYTGWEAPVFFDSGGYEIVNCKMPVGINHNTNVINITFNHLLATTAVQIFDKYGINISAGSACNSGEEKPSEAYLASGYSEEQALKTVRISVGSNNTMREARKFIKVLKKVIDNYDI